MAKKTPLYSLHAICFVVKIGQKEKYWSWYAGLISLSSAGGLYLKVGVLWL
jgi:hypothetical protein